jgi:hypothetical protein
MSAKIKFWSVILVSVCVTVGPTTNAFAGRAEVASKYSALSAKAYPPLVPGNPAAGRAGGNGHSVRKFFNRCIANGGHMHKYSSDNPSGKH